MRVTFDQDIHRHLPRGCVMERGPRAVRDTQSQTTHVQHTSSSSAQALKAWMTTLLQSCLQIRHSPVLTSRYPASSKLETETHSHSHHGTTDYPYLNPSLMQAIEDSNGGKHIAHRQKMLWVEQGRGE